MISYVDQDTVYHLSVLDKSPIRDNALQYHTVVRICLDNASQNRSHQDLIQPERLADGSNGSICALQYAPFPLPPGVSPQVLPALHSSLENSFSVMWSFNSVTGGSYCLIPIRFRNCTGIEKVGLKLFVGTERLQNIDAGPSHVEQYEESFACVRLFSSGQAQKTRAAEIAHVEQKAAKLQSAIDQANVRHDKIALSKSVAEDIAAHQSKAERPPIKKRKASDPPTQIKQTSALMEKLSSEKQKLSRVRPVQVFKQVICTQGQGSRCAISSHQTRHSTLAPEETRKGNESEHLVPLRTATYNRRACRREQEYRTYDSSTASPKQPSLTAEIGRRNGSCPGI